MDVKDNLQLGPQPPEERDGILVNILVFMMRCAIVFICAVARSIIVLAGNRIPESLFDHPYISGFVVDLLPSDYRGPRVHSRATQTTCNTDPVPISPALVSEPAQPDLTSQGKQRVVSASTYVIFVGRDVGYTKKRQVTIANAFLS